MLDNAPSEAEVRATLRRRLRAEQARAGLSNHHLSLASGVGTRAIVHYRAGKRAPRWPNLVRLADALGVAPASLLTDEPDEQESPSS